MQLAQMAPALRVFLSSRPEVRIVSERFEVAGLTCSGSILEVADDEEAQSEAGDYFGSRRPGAFLYNSTFVAEASDSKIEMPDGLKLEGIREAKEENNFIVEEMIERVYFKGQGVRIEENDEVWDVGAHCGMFLWGAVREAEGNFSYVGFEPVERSRQALTKNVETLLGRSGDWKIHGLAIGREAGEAEMMVYPR